MADNFGMEVYGEPLTPGGSAEANVMYSTREVRSRIQVIDSFTVTMDSTGSKLYDFLSVEDRDKLSFIAVPVSTSSAMFPRQALPSNNVYLSGHQINWDAVSIDFEGGTIHPSITSVALTQILVLL